MSEVYYADSSALLKRHVIEIGSDRIKNEFSAGSNNKLKNSSFLRFVIKSAKRFQFMEVTINLPEKVFANLSSAANQSHRRIDEVIAEKIERDFAIDADELEKQISVCSDNEVSELAEIQMSPEQDMRLSHLLNKQNEGKLSVDEQKEMWQLMETNRLTTLKKAYALREISRRGLDGKD